MAGRGTKASLSLGACPRPREGLAFEQYEGETIVVEPAEGVMHALTGVGPFLWERMDGSTSLEQLAQALCERYEVELPEARDDVLVFARKLIESGLLVLAARG
ncbi:MAG: PqqD family protein [Deltaproteobacteria bacterium]|nr:PqqD family protein [Deltaproteobacteria bacterium]